MSEIIYKLFSTEPFDESGSELLQKKKTKYLNNGVAVSLITKTPLIRILNLTLVPKSCIGPINAQASFLVLRLSKALSIQSLLVRVDEDIIKMKFDSWVLVRPQQLFGIKNTSLQKVSLELFECDQEV